MRKIVQPVLADRHRLGKSGRTIFADSMSTPKPFLTVENITVRLGGRFLLQNSFWQMRGDEQWAILGPNGAGKSTFVRTLWGGEPLQSGEIHFHFAGRESFPSFPDLKARVGYVSFEMHQNLIEQEEAQEEFREYAHQRGGGSTVREVIYSGMTPHHPVTGADEDSLKRAAELLGIENLLSRAVTSLSTGEMRKTLIARALIKAPQLLILDEPFDGLDEKTRTSLGESISHLMAGPLRVILVVHRVEELAPPITHILLIKGGQFLKQGRKEEVLTSENLSRLYDCPLTLAKTNGHDRLSFDPEKNEKTPSAILSAKAPSDLSETLIEMKEATVRCGEVMILDGLNWSMKRGENWAILGPNGSGKSTLLKLILGDHPQGYANEITLFGKRRGSGESIWEIKKYIGAVSPELQIQYRKKMKAYDVIASGFYDSIGLYQDPTAEQKKAVVDWIDFLQIEDLADQSYPQLSYGQKRMILLARALVKNPAILILDEPGQGLDIPNRRKILTTIEKIGQTPTQLLYVTHQQEEILPCITHILQLRKGKVISQGKKARIQPLLPDPPSHSPESSWGVTV